MSFFLPTILPVFISFDLAFQVTFSIYLHQHFLYIHLIPLKSIFSSASKKLTTGKPVTGVLFHEGY